MSHELRTPLNTIIGFTQLMLSDSNLKQENKENLSIIGRSGEHLLSLINDVLEMSKIESGRITLNEDNFDFFLLLDAIKDMFQLQAKSKDIELIFTCTVDTPRYIQTDQNKLRQVLINLLSNAIKFTDQGKIAVRVRLAEQENSLATPQHSFPSPTPHAEAPYPITLHFEVEDTGLGISPEELHQVFKPFEQTETGRKSQKGTGLGLTISRQFVRLMGGDIRVQSSKVGCGTTFGFEIQVKVSQTPDVFSSEPKSIIIGLEPNQASYRILVVDDSSASRKLMRKLIAPLGLEMLEASNGKEAIDLWKTYAPHLIWMDMQMPVMSGFEAVQQIRAIEQQQHKQQTVIIALTASVFIEEREDFFSAGCNDCVYKPFPKNVIFDKMGKYLGLRYIYKPLTEKSSEISEGQTFPLKEQTERNYLPQEAVFSPTDLRLALAIMPTDWIAKLNHLAILANAESIFQLIEQIPESNADLANTLHHLVNEFRFDAIFDATNSVIKQ